MMLRGLTIIRRSLGLLAHGELSGRALGCGGFEASSLSRDEELRGGGPRCQITYRSRIHCSRAVNEGAQRHQLAHGRLVPVWISVPSGLDAGPTLMAS